MSIFSQVLGLILCCLLLVWVGDQFLDFEGEDDDE